MSVMRIARREQTCCSRRCTWRLEAKKPTENGCKGAFPEATRLWMHLKAVSITTTIYADANHATHQDGEGHVGAIMTLGSKCIGAKSCENMMVTLSSTESG